MNREQKMDELMNDIQYVNFRRVYGNVSLAEEIFLLNKSRVLKSQLKKLENE